MLFDLMIFDTSTLKYYLLFALNRYVSLMKSAWFQPTAFECTIINQLLLGVLFVYWWSIGTFLLFHFIISVTNPYLLMMISRSLLDLDKLIWVHQRGCKARSFLLLLKDSFDYLAYSSTNLKVLFKREHFFFFLDSLLKMNYFNFYLGFDYSNVFLHHHLFDLTLNFILHPQDHYITHYHRVLLR